MALIGTLVWVFMCVVLALFLPWGAQIVVFLFAVLVPVSTYKARAMYVGDEDEVRADIRRLRAESTRTPDGAEDEIRLDPEFWLSRGGRVFGDVPPPPVLDDEQVGGPPSEQESAGGPGTDGSA